MTDKMITNWVKDSIGDKIDISHKQLEENYGKVMNIELYRHNMMQCITSALIMNIKNGTRHYNDPPHMHPGYVRYTTEHLNDDIIDRVIDNYNKTIRGKYVGSPKQGVHTVCRDDKRKLFMYRCKKCHKRTSTTNIEFFEKKLCRPCGVYK